MAVIEKAKGILIGIEGGELSPKAYGGYAFSANYSINFTQPSRLTISLVSKDGQYDVDALRQRIFPGEATNGNLPRGLKSFEHTVKSGQTVDSLSIEYDVHRAALYAANQEDGETDQQSIQRLSSLFEGQKIEIPRGQPVSSVSFLGGAITYDIIKFGGKVFKMHPLKYSIAEGPEGRYLQLDYYDRSITYLDKTVVVLQGKHLPPVYNPAYPPFAGAPILTPPNVIAIGQAYVNAKEFVSGPPGSPTTKTPTEILPTYLYSPAELYQGMLNIGGPGGWLNGVIDQNSCSLLQTFYNTYRSDFLKDHVGTLREVLAAWSQDLGFIFYWEPTEDRLKLMDLRSDLTFNRIQQTVGKVVDARNITDRNWSWSIEDTFSRGVAAYFGRNGVAEGRSSVDSFYMLDLMEIDLHECKTAPSDEVECDIAGSGEIYNNPDYCTDGTSPTRPWALEDMSAIRKDANKDKYLSYIRLLKAAAIGPDFFRVYVLNKKSVANASAFPDWGGTNQSGMATAVAAQQALSTSPLFFTNKYKLSGFSLVATYGISQNEMVEDLYYSEDPDEFNQLLECKDASGNVEAAYIVGKDCLSIELLDPYGVPKLKEIDQLYKLSESRLINASSNTGDDIEGMPYYFFRVKKYGLRSIIDSAGDDHIFKLLQAIAANQGRFYYSRQLQTAGDFSKKSYDLKSIRWFDREVDVNDTPFASLYASANPQSNLASVEMPNECIANKDRDSKQTKADGTAFENPANTARPTVEQFIQSVYNDTLTSVVEGSVAVLNVSIDGGQVSSISVSQGGENYLSGASGTSPVTVTGKGAGAAATATIVDGTVTEVTVSLGGTGYEDDTSATVSGSPNTEESTNVFGQDAEDNNEENVDSILQSNLTERNEAARRECEETDDRLGVIIADMGTSIKIPNAIQDRIERHVESVSPIPTSSNLSIVKFHDLAGYQILALAKPVPIDQIDNAANHPEYVDWFKEKKKQEIAPEDELDFIVDQVEIPNLDILMGESEKNKVAIESTYKFPGEVFEAKAMIRPLHESNVREVTMEFLTPAEKDFGVEDADCIADPDEQQKKREKDDKLIAGNIAAYANAFAFQQPRVEYNAQVTVADDELRNEEGEEIPITVEKGLESLGIKLSSDGTELTYTVGTRRKRRVVNKPFEDLWVTVKPEFYNNIFDI